MAKRLLRHEALAWLALLGLLAFSVLVLLPRLETRFRFRELFPEGHPARQAYDAHEENFRQGSQLLLYFHGERVFSGPFLSAARELGERLRQLQGTEGVLSAVDLREPRLAGTHQMLDRILRPEVLADPERLAAALARPPFPEHLHGFLYDRALRVYVVIVTPPLDDADPEVPRRYLAEARALAQEFARAQGVELFLGGHFFLRQEVRRVAIESQARVSAMACTLHALLFWGLFGSLWLVAQVFFLLGVSVLLGFAAMALLGIPVTFLSVNTAIMVLVIGTADLVHIAGRYAAARRECEPEEAAARASTETAVPVLLTSLTTAGCLLVTAVTPLYLVRQFSLALAAAVMVTWALAVTYGPLLLRRSGLVPGRGAYFWIHDALGRALEGRFRRAVTSRWTPPAFAVAGLAGLVLLGQQRVDSNWFRTFGPDLPVSQTMDFLERTGLPKTTIDCTLDVDVRLPEALADAALERDARAIAAAIARLPGVLGVEHLYSQLDFVRAQVDAVEYPASLAPRWRATRREGLLRQAMAVGMFDRYFGARRNQLRFLLLTGLEGSRDFVALRRQVEQAVAGLELETVRPEAFGITGQMHYWSAIMAAIPRSISGGLAGCLALIFLCFLGVSGSLRVAALALAPNVFPIVVMFGFGRLFATPLNENLIFSMSLAIGVAVDDTLHFLYHYRVGTDAGAPPPVAARQAFVTAGAPVVVTSLLLLAGFSLCLGSDVVALRQMGVLLVLAISSALLADLLLLPALLLRFDRPAPPGLRRGYEVAPGPGVSPPRRRWTAS